MSDENYAAKIQHLFYIIKLFRFIFKEIGKTGFYILVSNFYRVIFINIWHVTILQITTYNINWVNNYFFSNLFLESGSYPKSG